MWRPTRSFGRAFAIGLGFLVFAAIAGRADVAVLVTPLAVMVVWAMSTRPTQAPSATSAVSEPLVREGESLTWRVDVTAVEGLRDVVGNLSGDRWATTTPGHGHVAADAQSAAHSAAHSAVRSAARSVPLGVGVRCDRWGVRRLGPAQVGAFGDFAAFVWVWPTQATETVATVPVPGSFTARGSLPHPVGLVGAHRSSRPGGGSELADIRAFRSGDRLRRINWPVSLRSGTLHVTTTYADQDAEVLVVVDAIRDLGERDLELGLVTSQDIAVEAAGAVAAHYLSTGDRVGLSVLGGAEFVEVPAVGGHHQLARILLALGRAAPSRGTVGEEKALRAQLRRGADPGALVVLLSALVSPEALAQAVRLSRRGHVVIVIDTLPPELLAPDPHGPPVRAATGVTEDRLASAVWRLRLLEREREVRACTDLGVPVIRWQGAGSLDAVLRGVSRRARAPRVVAR
ncbi:MAG: DUF58 domain-containing protein [Ornithinibacter sp.]